MCRLDRHVETACTNAAITQPTIRVRSQRAFDLDAESIARGLPSRPRQTGSDRAGMVAGAAGNHGAAHGPSTTQ